MERLTVRVHDLVRLRSDRQSPLDPLPAWARESLDAAPWVVVRREEPPHDAIPVGVRGAARAERFATFVWERDIAEVVSPERVVDRLIGRDGRLANIARAVDEIASDCGLRWGILGSFGYELASGRSVTTPSSDLDVIIRAVDVALPAVHHFDDECRAIAALTDTRIDVEADIGVGCVALRELCSGVRRVMVKTAHGPTLFEVPS
jgi:phosphoribosyl-dephospho-CoA transferase